MELMDAQTPATGTDAAPSLAVERTPDGWTVESQSRLGLRHTVTRTPIGLWGCTCEWGHRAAERLNVKPCAHVRAVQTKEAAAA